MTPLVIRGQSKVKVIRGQSGMWPGTLAPFFDTHIPNLRGQSVRWDVRSPLPKNFTSQKAQLIDIKKYPQKTKPFVNKLNSVPISGYTPSLGFLVWPSDERKTHPAYYLLAAFASSCKGGCKRCSGSVMVPLKLVTRNYPPAY